jgi:probable rRNA maturation factor
MGMREPGLSAAVSVYNRQRAFALDMARLSAFAAKAARACGRRAPVEISLVSDRVMARVHREFLQAPGPTDVITFDHGELLIGVATGARQAAAAGESLDREIGRYIVHGLLHLGGYTDAQPAEAAAMWRRQEQVLERLWPAAAQESDLRHCPPLKDGAAPATLRSNA